MAMKKILVHAPGVKGVFLVDSRVGPLTSELFVDLLAMHRIPVKNDFLSYTEVDNYRLHTLDATDLRNIRTGLKPTDINTRKVSPDKLPVCWRNL
jgi:hypothetical protein